MHREALCEKINKEGRERKVLCVKICMEIQEGMRISTGVVEGIEFPHCFEYFDGSNESAKWKPPVEYFGTVTMLEENGQGMQYSPDNPKILEAWVDHAESPTRIPLKYGQEFIPSEDGRAKHGEQHGFIISLFDEREEEPEEPHSNTLWLQIGDEESVWWEKDVPPASLERELKRLRLMLPILGDALIVKEFQSAEPE